MHIIERSIIMAAGFGQRMLPVTATTPKPLIKVNGTAMIETIINSLHEQGVFEIYIVVGYKKEQFEYLTQKYKGITLIDNPYYESCNNIASLYVARDHICNTMILDGDQIIYDSKILEPTFEQSGYNAVWTDTHTNEWLMTVDKNDQVISCSRTGGEKGWILYSVSRWSEEDGKRLKKHLETEFEIKKNRQIYWDDVAMFCYPEEYNLGIKRMNPGDLVEIDSFEELCEIDNSYCNYK